MISVHAAAPGAGAGWPARLREAAAEFDWALASAVMREYVAHIFASSDPVPIGEAKEVLRLLRENRRYEDLLAVADALLSNQVMDAAVKRAIAQALVDRDRPAAALLVFDAIVNDPTVGRGESAEALGGVGRCTKEMFLRTTDPSSRATYLARSYGAYRSAYDRDSRNFWHGVNAAALLARAAREGSAGGSLPAGDPPLPGDPGAEAERLAAALLATVGDLAEPDVWALATACEASLALGDDDAAVARAMDLLATTPSAFQLAALLRQLTTLWQLDTASPPGDRLLPILRARLLAEHGGDVVLEALDLRRERLDPTADASLEKVFGDTGFLGLPWYRTGLERCRAVARIETESAQGVGTGFLVSGPALHASLPAVVLVTNAHVIPENLDYRDAFVAFHGLDADTSAQRRCAVRGLLWHEPSATPGLDASLLELDVDPSGVTALPLARDLPALGGESAPRAYIIGHPLGLETPQYSMQDNLILDYDDVLLHYRSPTDRGSSGSPVFDDQWRLIGLHHAGRVDTPKLHNQGGTYAANEAILLRAIQDRLKVSPPAVSPPAVSPPVASGG